MTDHRDNTNAAFGHATPLSDPEMTATRRQARRTNRNRAIAGASVGFAALGAALMMFAGTSSTPASAGIAAAGAPAGKSVSTPRVATTDLPTSVRPVAADAPGIPREFANACGRPGSSVQIRRTPLFVDSSKCDLVGVGVIYMEDNGSYLPLDVQASHEDTSISTKGGPSFTIDVDADTHDLTFRYKS